MTCNTDSQEHIQKEGVKGALRECNWTDILSLSVAQDLYFHAIPMDVKCHFLCKRFLIIDVRFSLALNIVNTIVKRWCTTMLVFGNTNRCHEINVFIKTVTFFIASFLLSWQKTRHWTKTTEWRETILKIRQSSGNSFTASPSRVMSIFPLFDSLITGVLILLVDNGNKIFDLWTSIIISCLCSADFCARLLMISATSSHLNPSISKTKSQTQSNSVNHFLVFCTSSNSSLLLKSICITLLSLPNSLL